MRGKLISSLIVLFMGINCVTAKAIDYDEKTSTWIIDKSDSIFDVDLTYCTETGVVTGIEYEGDNGDSTDFYFKRLKNSRTKQYLFPTSLDSEMTHQSGTFSIKPIDDAFSYYVLNQSKIKDLNGKVLSDYYDAQEIGIKALAIVCKYSGLDIDKFNVSDDAKQIAKDLYAKAEEYEKDYEGNHQIGIHWGNSEEPKELHLVNDEYLESEPIEVADFAKDKYSLTGVNGCKLFDESGKEIQLDSTLDCNSFTVRVYDFDKYADGDYDFNLTGNNLDKVMACYRTETLENLLNCYLSKYLDEDNESKDYLQTDYCYSVHYTKVEKTVDSGEEVQTPSKEDVVLDDGSKVKLGTFVDTKVDGDTTITTSKTITKDGDNVITVTTITKVTVDPITGKTTTECSTERTTNKIGDSQSDPNKTGDPRKIAIPALLFIISAWGCVQYVRKRRRSKI